MFSFTDGTRDSRGNKVSKRAKPLDPDEDDYYYDDPVDERNNPTNEAPVVPPGFLSPSVREYLDLGKSIPGTYKQDHLARKVVPLRVDHRPIILARPHLAFL